MTAKHAEKTPSNRLDNQYTLVVPVDDMPGKFKRRILTENQLKTLIDRWFYHPYSKKRRFYVEPHNGVDNDAIISNWPDGFYS